MNGFLQRRTIIMQSLNLTSWSMKKRTAVVSGEERIALLDSGDRQAFLTRMMGIKLWRVV